MASTWVLLWIILSAGSNGPNLATGSQEFASKDACENARAVIVHSWGPTFASITTRAECVKR